VVTIRPVAARKTSKKTRESEPPPPPPERKRRGEAQAEDWKRADPKDAARIMASNVSRLATDQAPRRTMARRRLETYLGRPVHSLTSELYYRHSSGAGSEVGATTTQSYAMPAVDTGQAQIASQQRPKGAAQTKGGDYYARQEAKKISKFFEGCLQAPQGSYANTWELTEHCFHDSEIFEAGCCKVFADLAQQKIVHERVFAHDIFFDPLDAHLGSPRSMYHMYLADKWELLERFPENEQAILGASLHPSHRESITGSSTDIITVFEGWRKGKNGRHIITVEGPGNNSLVDSEYDRDMFPIAFMLWQRNSIGAWGTPMVDQIAESQAYANLFLSWMLENARYQAGGVTFFEEGSIIDETMLGNLPFKMVPVKKGSQMPVVDTPAPFHPQFMDLFDRLRSMCFENVGVSEMGSQGKKEQSITSGVAIRTVNALQTQRFLPKSKAYEQFIVNINRLDLYAIQDLVDAGVSPSTVVESEGFLDTIDWDEITLPSDQFVVTLAASSADEDSPAARKQTVQDLIALGYQNIADELTQIPDIEWITNRQSAQRRYMDGVITRYMKFDARTEDVADVEDVPDPLFDLVAASVQMKDGYVSAKADGAPEVNLQLFRDWLTLADEALQKTQEPPLPPVDGAGAPPPDGGMPMAPPGGQMTVTAPGIQTTMPVAA
jgi:hypothetical protein